MKNNITSSLDLDVLNKALTTQRLGKAPGWTNEVWETIDSTNNRLAELAFQGAPAGVIVAARQQTAGRGRQGRVWISPPDAGIYASFLLRPTIEINKLPIYTLATGVACVQALQECIGITIGLKWVNDLVYAGKKVGGVLAEIPSNAQSEVLVSKESSGFIALIIGIGLNIALDESQIPAELVDRISWLEKILGQPIDHNMLLACLAKHIENTYDLISANKLSDVLSNWKKYSITLGKHIKATTGNNTIEGIAIDLDMDGGLIIDTLQGERTTLHAGEITIRNSDGTYV